MAGLRLDGSDGGETVFGLSYAVAAEELTQGVHLAHEGERRVGAQALES